MALFDSCDRPHLVGQDLVVVVVVVVIILWGNAVPFCNYFLSPNFCAFSTCIALNFLIWYYNFVS